MVAIRDIALANVYDDTLVAIIIQVEHRDRGTSRGRAPYNVQTCGIPSKVVSPSLPARIEEEDDGFGLWVAAFNTITSTLIAVATGECQIVGVI